MIQGPVKYIQVDYWNYWWCVYSTAKDFSPPHWVECSLTDDADGRMPFFHFDLYNLPGLQALLREGTFLPPDHPDHPGFLRRAEALERGASNYFIGALYYRDFTPDLDLCGLPAEKGISLLDLRSPPSSPYYAAVFLAEERPLTPEVLTCWTARLSLPLFGWAFACRIAHAPTRAEALASRLAETAGI